MSRHATRSRRSWCATSWPTVLWGPEQVRGWCHPTALPAEGCRLEHCRRDVVVCKVLITCALAECPAACVCLHAQFEMARYMGPDTVRATMMGQLRDAQKDDVEKLLQVGGGERGMSFTAGHTAGAAAVTTVSMQACRRSRLCMDSSVCAQRRCDRLSGAGVCAGAVAWLCCSCCQQGQLGVVLCCSSAVCGGFIAACT